MNPLERSYYIAIYPRGRIVEKHLTLTEAAHYCRTFNRIFPTAISWANYHPEHYSPPTANQSPPPPSPSKN